MRVEIRAQWLTPRQIAELSATAHAAFRQVAHRVAAVVITLSAQAERRQADRRCVVEVHMPDGHVEYVEERERNLGTGLRRAVLRAWRGAVRWIADQLPRRRVLHLPRRQMVLVPVRVRNDR